MLASGKDSVNDCGVSCFSDFLSFLVSELVALPVLFEFSRIAIRNLVHFCCFFFYLPSMQVFFSLLLFLYFG